MGVGNTADVNENQEEEPRSLSLPWIEEEKKDASDKPGNSFLISLQISMCILTFCVMLNAIGLKLCQKSSNDLWVSCGVTIQNLNRESTRSPPKS